MKMRKQVVSTHVTQNHIYSNLNSILDFQTSMKMCGIRVKGMIILYCLPGFIIEKKYRKTTLPELSAPNSSEMI